MSFKLDERYTIGRQIGAGGGGVVFEGRRLFALGESGQLDRDCAIKLIHASRAGDGRALRRFIDEAERGYQLTAHPNLIATRDFGETPDRRLYLVMDLAGQTLEELESELYGDLPLIRAIADAVLSALDHLHTHGVVHGDLCAGNIYLCNDGVIKVGDLGRSARFDGERVADSANDGTDSWRPRPEEDLYRFGLLLGRLLGGTPVRGQQGGRSWLPEGTPAELLTCVSRALRAQHETGENALTARELRTLLRETHTHIAGQESVADWLAARESSPDTSGDALGDFGDVSVSASGDAFEDRAVDSDSPSEERAAMIKASRPLSAALPDLLLDALQSRAVAAREPVSPAPSRSRRDPSARDTAGRFSVRSAVLLGLVSALVASVMTVYLTRVLTPQSHTVVLTERADRGEPSPARVRESAEAPVRGALTRVGQESGRALSDVQESGLSGPRSATASERRASRRGRVSHKRMASGTDRMDFWRYGQDKSGVHVTVRHGQWVDDDTVVLMCPIDNRSDSPYRLAHVQLLDEHRSPINIEIEELLEPVYAKPGLVGVVPASHVGVLSVRVPNASTLLVGQSLTMVFSERGGERSMTVGNLEWE